jgi:hypothetical protein
LSQPSPPQPQKAALSEGPARYACFEHKFETSDADEEERHKLSSPHYVVNGNTLCSYCQQSVHYEKLKYRGKDKLQGAVCEECAKENETKANAKRIVLEDTNKPETLSAESKKRIEAARAPQQQQPPKQGEVKK